MFTKACFDKLGRKCLLDRKGSEAFTKLKLAWDCLELWDQADAQEIFSLSSLHFSPHFFLHACLFKWHECQGILSQSCL